MVSTPKMKFLTPYTLSIRYLTLHKLSKRLITWLTWDWNDLQSNKILFSVYQGCQVTIQSNHSQSEFVPYQDNAQLLLSTLALQYHSSYMTLSGIVDNLENKDKPSKSLSQHFNITDLVTLNLEWPELLTCCLKNPQTWPEWRSSGTIARRLNQMSP